MQILVKLYATLREFAPPGTPLGQAFEVELGDETIRGLIRQLGIPPKEAYIVMVNGIAVSDLDRRLQAGDTVVMFPRIGGGDNSIDHRQQEQFGHSLHSYSYDSRRVSQPDKMSE